MQTIFQHTILCCLLASCFTSLVTTAGAACVFFTGKAKKGVLSLFSGGAAGIMLAAAFFSLILPAMEYGVNGLVPVGVFCGGGFLILSDLFLARSELSFRNLGGKSCALTFFAVTLHNIPEGLAIGVAFAAGEDPLSAVMLAVGIAIQNFPEGLCVALPLLEKGIGRGKSFAFSLLSGLVEIPACLLGGLIPAGVAGAMPFLLSFSAGAMILVVFSELIPDCFSGNKTAASLSVLCGFCLMATLDLLFG